MSTAVQVQIKQQANGAERYAERVNPAWVRLLSLLEMNVRYERCVGADLFTSDGRRILDFLSGYCVHNIGHNHPDVVAALQEELGRCGPAMIQTHVADLSGNWPNHSAQEAGEDCSARSFVPRAAHGWRPRSSLCGRICGARGSL